MPRVLHGDGSRANPGKDMECTGLGRERVTGAGGGCRDPFEPRAGSEVSALAPPFLGATGSRALSSEAGGRSVPHRACQPAPCEATASSRLCPARGRRTGLEPRHAPHAKGRSLCLLRVPSVSEANTPQLV